jgi:glycine hydroxymethyltransferase
MLMGKNAIRRNLELIDPFIHEALKGEKHRQQNQIELIASENTVSNAVLEALGSEITNKTVEGYPGNRFHGGAKFADIVEQAAIDRAMELFGCDYVNAQPHSGSQANQAVLYALLQPGDQILSLDLAAGGHLSHGAKANQSGHIYQPFHYHVSKETGLIEYDKVEEIALEVKPKLLIAGGSAYPREIDFERMRHIANRVNAFFLVDMAHFAGLVAAKVHPSPVSHADVVTLTTTKTMRGARGGLILSNNKELFKKLQSSVFPGVQGSIHLQVIAAKAVCLGEALQPDFKTYGRKVRDNARVLAKTLSQKGVKIIAGGTDTHLVLLDLSNKKITGQQAQDILEQANITSNKNPIPFDSPIPSKWIGLRLGSSAGTTRGFEENQFQMIGEWIAELFDCVTKPGDVQKQKIDAIKKHVSDLCKKFPIYE